MKFKVNRYLSYLIVCCLILSSFSNVTFVNALEETKARETGFYLNWWDNKEKTIDKQETTTKKELESTILLEDQQMDKGSVYTLYMGKEFNGEITTKEEGVLVEKGQDHTWKISLPQKHEYTGEVLLNVLFKKKQEQVDVMELHDIYAKESKSSRRSEERLSAKISFLLEESSSKEEHDKEKENKSENSVVEESSMVEKVQEEASTELIAPYGTTVANLSVSEVYSPKSPLSGQFFNMTVRINSVSTSESTDAIKNMKVEVTLPAPEMVTISELPSSNAYTVSTQTVGSETVVTIQYKKDIGVGEMVALPFGLKYIEGTSLPSDLLRGNIKVSAENAVGVEKELDGIYPQNKVVNDKLTKELDPDAEAVFLHTAKLRVASEDRVGGLNVKNANLHIELPEDIILYSVEFKGVLYEVEGPKDGKYFIDIPMEEIKVGDGIREVMITYEYPYSNTGKEKEYEIKATLTGTRWNGDSVEETESITDVAPPSGEGGYFSGTIFFDKKAPQLVLQKEDVFLSYKIVLKPKMDLRDASIVDDPVRSGNEDDFFEGFQYEDFSWTAQPSKNPEITGFVNTEILYQTNLSDTWMSMNTPSRTGQVKVSSLGLEEGESITNVKYVYTYLGTKEIPKNAGYATVSVNGKTKKGVPDKKGSLADGITNTAYIYGDRKPEGVSAEGYQPFVDGGYEAKNDDEKNTRTVTTHYKGEGAYPGYIGWEQPFSPQRNKIGDTFTYSLGVNNVFGTGDLKDPILYITVPANINIESVELLNPAYNPNAQITSEKISKDLQLVTIKYHANWPKGESWNYNHGIKIKANGSIYVNGEETFSAFLVSGDPSQAYDGGVGWTDIPGVGGRLSANSRWHKVLFERSIGVQSTKTVSEDGITYDRILNTTSTAGGKEVTYRISIPNNGSVPVKELHVIDQLPFKDDTMTVTDAKRNSTVGGYVKKISIGGQPLGTNFRLSYSTDSTASKNKQELQNLTSDQSTWTTWDGTSSLPASAKAIKIIKQDGLDVKEKLEFEITYQVPEKEHTLDTLWNSFAVGGSYLDGTTEVPLEVGEPIKTGIYLSDLSANKELGGVLWKDDNGNGIRDDKESRIPNAVVRLYDWNNDIVGTTVTNTVGEYKFTGLYESSYRVEIDTPKSSYTLSSYQIGLDKTVDSDFVDLVNGKMAGEAYVDLTKEEEPLHIDAGYFEGIRLEGYVWYDDNKNGLQDSFETPVSGNLVSLYRVDDTEKEVLVETTSTISTGKYYFTSPQIKPGKYKIVAEIPEGYTITTKGATPENKNSKFNLDGKTDIIEVLGGTNSGWDMGIYEGTQTIDIKGQKIWNDDINQGEQRPDSILVYLLQNGFEYSTQKVEPDQEGNWNFIFAGLPEKDKNGKEYQYTLDEEKVNSYEAQIDNTNYTITNTYVEDHKNDKISIPVKKVWEDESNKHQKRPTSITVSLLQNKTFYEEQVIEQSDSKLDAWEFEFTELPKYDAQGEEYEYTLVEDEVDLYKAEIDQDMYTITNTYIDNLKNDKISIPVKKVWEDESNKRQKRPASITVSLLQNGEVYRELTVDAPEVSADTWEFVFKELPRYDKKGQEYIYTLKEASVSNYIEEIDQQNYQITNHYTETVQDFFSLSGKKIWVDDENQWKKRPEEITVNLMRNGSLYQEKKVKQKEDGSDIWSFEFLDLPKYDWEGKEWTYTIEEKQVPFYEGKVDQGASTITNIFKKAKPEIPKLEKKRYNLKNERKNAVVKTGDTTTISKVLLLLSIAGISFTLMISLFMRKSKKRQ